MSTTNLVNEVIERRAREIRGYIEIGWTTRRAIAEVKASSTLGPKAWAQVLVLAVPPVGRPLDLGCTVARHALLGIHAVINARGCQQWRNDDNREAVEMMRDARKVRDHAESRVIIRQFNSRPFRRRLAHLVTGRDE